MLLSPWNVIAITITITVTITVTIAVAIAIIIAMATQPMLCRRHVRRSTMEASPRRRITPRSPPSGPTALFGSDSPKRRPISPDGAVSPLNLPLRAILAHIC